MISRGGNKNFIVAHYEWLATGVGVLALVAGVCFYMGSLGADPDEAASEALSEVVRMKPSANGVKPVDMTELAATMRALRTPPTTTEISGKGESFLASERRVFCVSNSCGKVISGDIKTCPICPFCGAKQEEEVKVVLDSDGDGMPDEWEKKYALDVKNAADASADKDGDGFTNLEEYQADPKTDPTDPRDHPDYLDYLIVQPQLKETRMPFVFRKATQIPNGWRCEFFDPSRKDDYGRKGRTVSVKVGEKIIDVSAKEKFEYGFTLKDYKHKTEKRERKGMQGMKVEVDISEVVVERDSDGKLITLVVQAGKGAKLAPVDIQATLVYNRGQGKTFEVTPGAVIELYGTKYKIADIKASEKGPRVTVENLINGKRRTLQAP